MHSLQGFSSSLGIPFKIARSYWLPCFLLLDCWITRCYFCFKLCFILSRKKPQSSEIALGNYFFSVSSVSLSFSHYFLAFVFYSIWHLTFFLSTLFKIISSICRNLLFSPRSLRGKRLSSISFIIFSNKKTTLKRQKVI